MSSLEKIKDVKNLSREDYSNIVNNAMICEVGFFIGIHKEINDYLVKNVLSKCNLDGFLVFYLFCEYVVDVWHKGNNKGLDDLYYLLENEYDYLINEFSKELE